MARLMTLALSVTAVAAAIGALAFAPGFLAAPPAADGTAPRAALPEAVPVIVEPVVLQAERTRLEAVGTSRAIRSVTLHPAAAGEVTAVNFDADQRVAAGQVLVELDDRDARLALELARVRVQDAERLLRRYEGTRGSGAVSPTLLDEARTALELARLERDRAQLALDDRTIEAPFAGHVGLTEVDPGDRINPDTPIASLDDRGELLVSFQVPEIFIDRLAVGQPITVATWAARGARAEGRIVAMDSRIDPVSRTFAVRARVPNPDDRLRPGMSFRVTLELEGPRFPVVPEVAVQWGGDGSYVWAVDGDRARRVAVAIVQRREGRVLVDAALAGGTPVVVEGVQRMREGLEVRPGGPDLAQRPAGEQP